jgi:hypothetical protein
MHGDRVAEQQGKTHGGDVSTWHQDSWSTSQATTGAPSSDCSDLGWFVHPTTSTNLAAGVFACMHTNVQVPMRALTAAVPTA